MESIQINLCTGKNLTKNKSIVAKGGIYPCTLDSLSNTQILLT